MYLTDQEVITAVGILFKIDHKVVKIDFSLFIFDRHPLSEIRLTSLVTRFQG